MNRADHPTVRRFHENAAKRSAPLSVIDAAWLRQLCLDCGADDAGLVEISRRALTTIDGFVAKHREAFVGTARQRLNFPGNKTDTDMFNRKE